MHINKNILHYAKFVGLLAVVLMIWLTANRVSDPPRFASGRPKTTGAFIHGRAEGTWTWWFENGNKMTEGNFTGGTRNGTWRTWYEDGTIRSESTYFDDKLNGPYIQWYKNGKEKHAGNFKNDKRDGLHQHYDTSGILLEKRFYIDGIFASEN